MPACEFCDEFSGGSKNSFADRYSECLRDRVIFRSENFRLLPTLGQLAEGHLLLVPSGHVRALADIPDSHIAEFEALCGQVRCLVRENYGDCVFFEHGMRNTESGGCGIDHAHMHVLPVRLPCVPTALAQRFSGKSIDSVAEIRSAISHEESYLFFEDSLGQRTVFAIDEIPSQYMRKLIAETIGKQQWNWRECGLEPELIATFERLTPAMTGLHPPKVRRA